MRLQVSSQKAKLHGGKNYNAFVMSIHLELRDAEEVMMAGL